ncbi:glycosyltransferase family 2 protein [Novosphingobium profundi]|uniref:glycosyltransferase family 2 protein n=1 Tax=Novosphingobium profundi TaxID=1774954 RepID=UPI001CFE7DAE|nr:glycosyltransferase family 2 protein [Novosphingobium profundi]
MVETRRNPDRKPTWHRLVRAGLTLRIHLQALRSTPRPYALAAWWRLNGKRVRAHAHFAPLLAKSPLAYKLWMLDNEVSPTGAETSDTGPAQIEPPRIAAIVYDRERGAPEARERTLRSLCAERIDLLEDLDPPEISDFAGPENRTLWILPIAAGDILAPGAGAVYGQQLQDRAQLIYADDDLLDRDGQRHSPHFKPEWNKELFQHLDYLSGACILRVPQKNLAGNATNWQKQLHTLVDQAREGDIRHIPQVLHHRQSRPTARMPGAIAMDTGAWPSVSAIVPTRNGLHLLRTCIEGLERTNYSDLEVIIVDNGSDDPETLAYLAALAPERYRVLRHPGPFNFSALNNRAASDARGELLCLLNNDIEIIDPDWLRILVHQALRPDVGAVGAQLLYPDGRIQHAGVVLGIGGGAAHAHRRLSPDEEGYFRRHALPQFTSAVTAACLVVQRARFEAVGGLDETQFAVAFNDVDLCLRLNRQGWQSFYEPRARLIHHESVSRGHDRDPTGAARLANELAALKSAWSTDRITDPFHHPQLNPFSEHFVVRL